MFLSHSAASVPLTETLILSFRYLSFMESKLNPRHIVGTSPWRRVFDIIVPGHVFCCDNDLEASLL